MKLKTVLAIMLFAFVGVISTNPAKAVTMSDDIVSQTSVDLYGTNPSDPSTLEIGQSGTMSLGAIQYSGDGRVIYDISSYIPANSQITFSYMTSGFVEGEGLAKSYAFLGEDEVSVTAYPGSEGGLLAESEVSGLAYVSAQFGSDSSEANHVIRNLSGEKLGIMTWFEQLYEAGDTAGIYISYEVSAVPLPAALPMFGLGLLAMAGLRRKRVLVRA